MLLLPPFDINMFITYQYTFSPAKKRDEKALAKENRKKDLNNARARKSRLKKKKFFLTLEDKYKELEDKIEQRENKIAELETQIQSQTKHCNNSQKEYTKDLINDCNTIIEHFPKSKEFQLKEQEIAKQYAPFGSERVRVIDKAFSTILENLYPDEYKIIFKQSEAAGHKRMKKSENNDQPGKNISVVVLILMK
jgi:predicted nuclease with TOPRIM domain